MIQTASRCLKSQLILLLLPLMLLFLSGTALAEVVGKFTRVEGAVDIMPGGQLPAILAKDGSSLQKGDFVRTKSNARAEITFTDGSVIKVAQRSRIDVSEYSGSARKLALPRGKVQAIVVPLATGSAARTFEIRTPNAIAGVRGTSFYVYHQANVTGVAVTQGVVYTASIGMPTKGVTLVAGTATTVTKGHVPTPARPISQTEMNSHRNEVAPTGTGGGGNGAAAPASSSDSTPAAASGSAATAASAAVTENAPSISTGSTDGAPLTAVASPTTSAPAPAPNEPVVPPSFDVAPKPTFSPTSPSVSSPVVQNQTFTPPVTDNISKDKQDEVLNQNTPTPPAPILFSSDWKAGLMARDSSIDSTSNLLTIVSDSGFAPTLSGTASLWGGSATAALSGLYPTLVKPSNRYWFGNTFSNSKTNQTTADGGAYFGYFGGMSLVSGATNATLTALYLDPNGKTGIVQGLFPGTITNGSLNATGTLTLIEMNSASGLSAASFTAHWWDTKTGTTLVDVTGPVLAQFTGTTNNTGTGTVATTATPTAAFIGDKSNPSEGLLLDSSLNIVSKMKNRGDVLRLTYINSDPSFGIWGRESFGSYDGNGSKFVLISRAKWGTFITDSTSFNLLNDIQVISLGNWQPDGSLTGIADGVWGDINKGNIKLLTGTLTGSSNSSTSTFGAATTGSFMELSRFLANPALAGSLGFPTLKSPNSFSLSGTNAGGNVDIGTVSFYSRSASDPVSLWIAPKVTGTYTGSPLGQNYSLILTGATPGSSTILGNIRINSVSPATGSSHFLGEIDAIGETAGSFRSEFDGVVAGSFNGTTSTFSGSAAGLSHPVTYYSKINGAASPVTRFFNGAIVSNGKLDGILGGMSLWGSTPALPSDFKAIGFMTPTLATTASDFVMYAPVQSKDIPRGDAMTADLGAYQGHLVAGISTNGNSPGIPGLRGIMNALSIDPAGNAGILHGSFSGYVDPTTNIWNTDGKAFAVTLATASAASAATLNNAGSISTIATPYGAGTVFNGAPAIGTPVADAFTRSYITSFPDWGIGQFAVYAPYASAPAANTPWNVDFAIKDANASLSGTMSGDFWDTNSGSLHAGTWAGWHDMSTAQVAATPMTGIYIGETVGTFNPNSLQAMTSGVWMETHKFLGLAATAAGQATLQKLNIPAVEVGKADFAGSNADFSVTVTDLKFFAPVSGGRPQLFATDKVGGTYSAVPSGSLALSQVGASAATSGLSPSFTMNQWDVTSGKWSATLSNTGGTVAGNSNIQFKGPAAGRINVNGPGTFTGTAAGAVK